MFPEHDRFDPSLPIHVSDIPLTFRWSGVTDDHLATVGIKPGKLGEAAKCLLAALLVGDCIGRWTAYSRNRNFYSGWRRYEGRFFTYNTILETVEAVLDCGLIVEERAPQHCSPGWQSRMRASALLRELASQLGPTKLTLKELIHLKNAEKRRIDYTETTDARRMRAEMARINEGIKDLKLGFSDSCLDLSKPVVAHGQQLLYPSSRQLFRCFNASWTLGGRAYGGFWQNLPSATRKRLTINGAPVVETDYANLHPSLLYALHGARLAGDAYEIDGVPRKIAKLAWQLMINCTSVKAAVYELEKSLRDSGEIRDQRMCREILQALERRHSVIGGSFYSVVGRRLQYIDSELMMRVLARCLNEGHIGLPVHDSVIAIAGAVSDRTREIMCDELEVTLRELRSGCRYSN